MNFTMTKRQIKFQHHIQTRPQIKHTAKWYQTISFNGFPKNQKTLFGKLDQKTNHNLFLPTGNSLATVR